MPKKILIIEDNPDICEGMKINIEKEGYVVVTAGDADEGLKQWEKEKPDVILLDMRMPGTPVEEIIPKMKGAKIIYTTAVGMDKKTEEETLKQENVVGIVKKPFTRKELLEKIKQFA